MKYRAFVLYDFLTGNKKIELILPETWQAASLFNQLQKNFVEFSKYLKWPGKINSAQDEAASIKMFQEKMVAGKALNLVILVDGVPSGMIDLHELNQISGEVGYWLSRDAQHLGIMSKSVEFLVEYAFKQLKLEFLILRTAQDNLASQHVAERTGFQYIKDDQNYHKVFVLKNECQ
ncbi:GNAT family N-acetyltransferase [Lactobacillus kalixensis]|uniref:N-acetyltransferase n=1 Tax=Lactobacillus kalixensis DSM 16043 TaxID=1423763 RepID=A0A0R1UA52_9LACO|nr:GNAT family N-acetyltransferase [Lactobacillus kalixensis]KRL90193.1 N-acetyltransferase [Lactobacillus kalixensis DSM 16043]